jgi:hypothetical protein
VIQSVVQAGDMHALDAHIEARLAQCGFNGQLDGNHCRAAGIGRRYLGHRHAIFNVHCAQNAKIGHGYARHFGVRHSCSGRPGARLLKRRYVSCLCHHHFMSG